MPAGTGELEDSAKTDASEREIELWSEDFRAALAAMLARRREKCFAAGRGIPDFLFCEKSGHMINYSRYVKSWNHAQRLAGVRQRSPHSLRHTFASHMIESGEDIASVARHLGHANPGITLSIYTHFLPGKRRQRGNALDRDRANRGQTEEKFERSGESKTG